MAVVFITEYAELGTQFTGGEVGQMPMDPPLAQQTVAIGAEAKSAFFNAKTKFVRVHTDAICSILIGTTPTATTASARFSANQTEYRAVPVGGAYRLSVITNS